MSPKQSSKLDQFLAEISEVQERYQYALKAQVSFTVEGGVVPKLVVVEIIPPKKEIIKKTKKESHARS